jgi:hypothetical protein
MHAIVATLLAAAAVQEGTQMRNIGEYARAAELFEKHAREAPTDADAKTVLTDAIVLRFGLGDETQALADTDLFLRNYGNDPESATVAAAIVLHVADREDWAATIREAGRKMTLVDRGPIALRMQTHAALARAEAATHDPRASREYARVRDMSRELGAPPADPLALRRFARGLEALGEALVFAADEKRDAASWAPLPANASATATTAWITARVATIRALEAEYRKVVDIQPAAPPRWVVAAAARSAAMWTRTADEIVAHMPPKTRNTNVPIRDVDAKREAKACLDFAAKYQWTDDESRACGAWLEKTFRREFPPLDELLIVPRMRAASLVVQAPIQ